MQKTQVWPWVGKGNPLEYSWLENSMDRGAWWPPVHGVAKIWSWLSLSLFHLSCKTFILMKFVFFMPSLLRIVFFIFILHLLMHCITLMLHIRLLRVPWTARRSNQSIMKEINSEYSLEGLILKLQCFDHLMWRADSLEKTLMLGKIEDRKRRSGGTNDEIVGLHHPLSGHEFEQTPGDSEGQKWCSPWGHKDMDMTRRLNNKNRRKSSKSINSRSRAKMRIIGLLSLGFVSSCGWS